MIEYRLVYALNSWYNMRSLRVLAPLHSARRTMAQYPSQPAGFEEGPKNPLKGTSMKPLVSASYAQSGVDAGGRQLCLRRSGAFQWHEMSDPPAVETGSRAAAYSLCGLNDRCTVPA